MKPSAVRLAGFLAATLLGAALVAGAPKPEAAPPAPIVQVVPLDGTVNPASTKLKLVVETAREVWG